MSFAFFKNKQWSMASLIELMPKQNLLMLCVFFLLSGAMIFSIAHVLIVNREEEKLSEYAQAIYERANSVSFQIYKTFDLIEELGEVSCDNKYLHAVNEILSHHHMIEDAGRIVGHDVLCAAKMGVFNPPKKIDYKVSSVSSIKDIKVLLTDKGIFFKGERRSVLNYKEIFITLVPTIYIGIDSPDQHSGAFFKHIDSGKIARVFHYVDRSMAEDIYEKSNSNLHYFPLPNQLLRVDVCSETYRFCIEAVDYRVGVYDIPIDIILLLVFLSFIIAYSVHISIFYVKNIKGTMKYRLGYAIDHNQIYPLYQPKINLKTGQIVGVEALARWHDEKLGFVPPDVFIALAEEMRIVKKITNNLTKIVLQESKNLLLNDKDFTVSINLSVQDLLDADFLSFIEREVELHGVRRHQIILEITERSATESEGLSSSTHALYEKGYQISLDDFGTGFCNLSWLSKLESNEIKIDRMFTHSISSNSVGLITLDGICQLLENFKMKTVFEGIETQTELEYILAKSPEALGQGWLFAKAMPISEVEALVKAKTQLR